jgi:hypothetical protein
VGCVGTVVPEVIRMDTDVVRVCPLAPFPVAVITHVVPGTAFNGMVIVVVNSPEESAVTVIVSSPQMLSVTVAPGAYPKPCNVTVPPGGAEPELVVKPPQGIGYPQAAAVRWL